MRKKFTILTAALALLAMLAVPKGGWGQTRDTKTEGFETATTSSNYQSTVTITESDSDCGIGWEIYYGAVSTSSAITDNNSAALRLYNSDNHYAYIKTTTAIDGLSNVAINAKAATTNSALILINVDYSTNGDTWTNIESDKTLTSSAALYNWNIPSGGKYFRISISENSTKPSKKNAQLTIDDVVFTYSTATYTVTYDCNDGEGCPTEPVTGIVEGNSITLPTAPTREHYAFGGWFDGTTTYDAGASYTVTGNVTMTAQWIATYGYTLNITGETSHAQEVALYINNGTLVGDDEEIPYGTEVTVSVIPDEGYNYSVSVEDANGDAVDFDATNSSFTMPASAVTITVNIPVVPTYTVTFSTNGVEHGTISVVQGYPLRTLLAPATDYIPEGYTFMGWIEGDYPLSDAAPAGYIEVPYTPLAQGNVTLNAVFAQVSGSSSTGTLTGDEIASNFANPSMAYANPERSFVDGDFTWSARCTTNTDRHWIQLKNDDDVYIKIVAPYSIQNVEVTISNASNSSGGIDNINMHGNFDASGHIYLNTTNGGDHVGDLLGSAVNNHIATVVPSGSYSTLYLQVSAAARIWGINVISGSISYSNYRTSYSESYQMTIAQHGGTTADGGWYLIASPVASVTPTADNGFITTVQDDYDLYRFDQNAELEWENYKATSSSLHPDFIALVNGRGYLYANGEAEGTTLTFEGAPYNGNGEVQLYNVEGAELAGWNLIGNPFGTPATIGTKPYYRMNYTYDNGVIVGGGNELEAATGIIAPMEGIFVHVSQDSTLTFNHATTSAPAVGMVAINILQEAQRGASQTIDRAIVRFGENGTLPKFQLNPNHTKVYIPQDGKDYAVVGADNEGEMPVSFRAAQDGTYTLTVNPEGVEMNYLHLIDNMTGNDVDLLATPSYTFNATTRDYESRFRLVFAANNENGASAGSTTFAYFSNGSLVVNNEGNATLQVVDVMGRIVKSESINGSASINVNAAPGVYTLRLVNGNDVKTQKVVVR